MAAGQTGPQDGVIAFLEGGGLGAPVERRIDTHAAMVFLTRDRAWKLKRAAHYSYLDFSTAEARHQALEAELRLNRRTAPDLYLAVHVVAGDPDGGYRLDGEGAAADWLLEMRRFPDDALLDRLANRGPIDDGLILPLADRIRALHAAAPADRGVPGAEAMRAIVDGNAESMAESAAVLRPDRVEALCRLQHEWIDRFADRLDARACAGRVRRGHGDLHLANIALIDGAATPFDCLEFSDALATTDLLYDLAFLVMDLWHRGRQREANILLNRYLDLSPEDEDGLCLMPLFLSIRATIRAHIAAGEAVRDPADGASEVEATSYLALAEHLLAPCAARLVAIGGFSGTGKSTLARALAYRLDPPPGARILRSDVLRKRLAGRPPETRLGPEHYTPPVTARVFALLDRLAADALAGGQSVVADAVFARTGERAAIAYVAATAGARFDGLWLHSDEAERVVRVERRQGDASDADGAIARAQSRLDVGALGAWQIVPSDGDMREVTARACARLSLPDDRA
ncbi:bifunctional aminoglycoside phosphotransferase/ATP-binding protein [Flavisphingomonas formosensis]|uniref:bifunctional aminoglycoside phosphotransferase/ATP-binding protein n=1 Tax=Flavisphingomonas formosensis TaxID=861534 RepID=UPI0012F883A2|nr:AAA family ATPase [Sphingomonas formosensis]